MKHSEYYQDLSKIFKRLEEMPENSVLSSHVKHAVDKPPPVPETIYQLKTVCAIAPTEAKKILGNPLFEILINL